MSEQQHELDTPDPGAAPVPPPPAPTAAAQGYDDILEDIDEILEENALTFVKNFVQLGGQ